MNQQIQEARRAGLGRRQVLQATAWSAPVIAVAVAAPMAAASGVTIVSLQPFIATGVTTSGTSAALARALVTVTGASTFQASSTRPALANDGNTGTFWHNQYAPESPEPWIGLQGPADYSLTGLVYTPRQDTSGDGLYNGVANSYRIEGSNDSAFGSPVALTQGNWDRDKTDKTATFPATSFRYIRLYVVSQHGTAGTVASAAEIRLRGYAKSTSTVQSFEGSAGLFNQSVDPGASVTNATLTVTVPSAGLSPTLAPTFTGTGWSYGSRSAAGTSYIFTFSYAGTVAPGTSSPTLQCSLNGDGSPAGTALPKTATGVLSGSDFATTTSTTTWN